VKYSLNELWVGSWTHAASERVYRGERGFLELFVLVQRHPTRYRDGHGGCSRAAKPLTTTPSLIVYTVISLEIVAFRFYLAALRAHVLNRRLKKYLPQCVL